MTPKPAAHENPLIPNARLRQIYRAILHAHLLGRILPPAQRVLTASREAALVSTSIDLTRRDLVLDAFASPVVDLLRGASLHRVLHPHSKSAARIIADSGSPSHLPSPSNPGARIHSAVGAASTLKSQAAATKSAANQGSSHNSAVVLATAVSGEVPEDIWKPALSFAGKHDLPVIFVMLPPSSPSRSARAFSDNLRAIAHRAGVPAIPVDAADAVALYRVAQESIGHARIGGGPALIECLSFPAPASASLQTALGGLQQYMLQRGIVTQHWMERESIAFSAKLRRTK